MLTYISFKGSLFIFLISLLIGMQSASIKQKLPDFDQYLKQFNKKYQNPQYSRRLKYYQKNIEYLQESNCQACGVNKFTDWSPQEMKGIKGSSPTFIPVMNPGAILTKTVNSLRSTSVTLEANVPRSFDWRVKGAVTQIRDQIKCGACWAFSTAAFFQSDLIINNNYTNSLDLSQQFLITCQNRSMGCAGGFLFKAMQKVIQNGGIPTQKQYPYNIYSIRENMCIQTDLIKVDQNKKLISYYNIENQRFIEQLILKKPVNINLCSNDLQFYSPFQNSRMLKCNKDNNIRDHSVLLVGYTETQWIIKNQWGANWGVGGYAYISRDPDNDCCIGTELFTTGVVTSTDKCKVSNCQVCIQQTSCNKCKPGYYVLNNYNNIAHQCVQCKSSNCQQCQNYYGTCTKCKEGYSLYYPTFTCGKKRVENCEFMFDGHCDQCNEGYGLNNKKRCEKISVMSAETLVTSPSSQQNNNITLTSNTNSTQEQNSQSDNNLIMIFIIVFGSVIVVSLAIVLAIVIRKKFCSKEPQQDHEVVIDVSDTNQNIKNQQNQQQPQIRVVIGKDLQLNQPNQQQQQDQLQQIQYQLEQKEKYQHNLQDQPKRMHLTQMDIYDKQVFMYQHEHNDESNPECEQRIKRINREMIELYNEPSKYYNHAHLGD